MCPSGRSAKSAAATSDFRSAFDVLDADRDGKISRDDLRTFYGGEKDEMIGTMISAADSNRDGFVEYDEFERVLEYRNRSAAAAAASDVMGDIFRVMDRDGDGWLSHEDLKNYMNSAGFSASDEDIAAMIRLGGGNEKEGVSFDGFLKILAVG